MLHNVSAHAFAPTRNGLQFSLYHSINVGDKNIALSNHVKILGVVLDKTRTLNNHIGKICRSSFFHIRSLRHIRKSLDLDTAKTIGSSIVGARLDYANSLL